MNIPSPELVCPSCRATVQVSGTPVQPTFAAGDPTELLDGFLRCDACATEYPTIQGLAILVPNPQSYLAANYAPLSSLIANSQVNAQMRQYLEREGFDLIQAWGNARFYDSPDALNMYLASHYDRLSDIVERDTGPFAAFVASNADGLFEAVTEMIDRHLPADRRVALDVGANVGGMTWRLARRFPSVYGIDVALAAVSTARRVLLHTPQRLTRYRLYQEGRRFDHRRLTIDRHSNIELLVASGLNLPFRDAQFDLINCSNVIDVVADPGGLIAEVDRALKPGGLMVQSDPYRWEIGNTELVKWIEADVEGGASAGALVSALGERGYDILEERDMVPWILRRYRRQYSVWLNHCVVARKRLH